MTGTEKAFVAYRRVSTEKQGRSGLGLEAQEEMIGRYIAGVGGKMIGAFTEVESGKSDKNRPELKKAMALAKKHKATLIVAKLDRLARNVAFVSTLLETPGVEFKAADFPDASRMVIQMLAVFAEYERRLISERTKAAYAAKRRRDPNCKFGNPDKLLKGHSPAPEMNRAKANAEAERMRPIVDSIRKTGVATVRGICATLNDKGYTTVKGLAWHPTTVARLMNRVDRKEITY